jgi:glycine cleavage system H protein
VHDSFGAVNHVHPVRALAFLRTFASLWQKLDLLNHRKPQESDMSKTPDDLRYAKSHEWVRKESDGTVTVGISDHAQELLGDLVFVETPEVGSSHEAGTACAVVESVKAASDVYAPVSGEVVAVNEALADSPELVNSDPYGEGWLFRIKPADASAADALMDADAYQAAVDEDR